MKVKCIKLKTEKTYQIKYIPDWMNENMKVDDTYTVFGLNFNLDMLFVCIFFDERHLVEVPMELFEVIDNTVSSEWKAKLWENGRFTLWPEMFYEEAFSENFSDWQTDERERFSLLKERMEKEMS
ncbi:hypothetical protein [Leptospira noguchii]|uniref:Uncharacterized protein n=1 Tax=Leptospira noguchii TaxID=28182 RepID=A0AAE9GJ68_9LEPT|nr:hypothetical protein [Leptospira noguchii]UOG32741.1 hypothetical protein MAL06_20865 [Leptospira noguchii]UOG32773.1 hypothetical protein MAL06_20725 [Leptospira noguchii]UOG43616.1 hypothetical protein MAL05_19065 [Leptospira noguchii]UOG58932.1 hypothetical protein MAL03_20650 [Leptospira noguchii]